MKINIFQGTKDLDVITVSIVENLGYWKMWNCPTCKAPVFQYKGRILSIVPGFVPTEVPILVQCSNRECRQKYLISTIFSRNTFI